MIYYVTAVFQKETACLFWNKLTKGRVAAQQPDGLEIIASMHRAVILEDQRVAWTETCFCRIPLSHERKTVLDAHFEGHRDDEGIEPHQPQRFAFHGASRRALPGKMSMQNHMELYYYRKRYYTRRCE